MAEADWNFVKRFLDEKSGFTVEVQKDEAVDWPKFSIRVGRMILVEDEEGDENLEFRPFLPIFVDRSSVGKSSIRFSLQIVQYQLQEAESFVLDEVQKYEYAQSEKMVNSYEGPPRRPKKTQSTK